MIVEYLNAALERASYDKIDDEEPYYGEVPGIDGLWATGPTLEQCRRNLREALEDWILFSVQRDLAIPPLGEHVIELSRRAG